MYYYIPPQIWASRKWRIHTVKKHIDKVLTIFPFEKKMYDEYGIDSQFVGHPLLTQIPPKADKNQFFEEHNQNCFVRCCGYCGTCCAWL